MKKKVLFLAGILIVFYAVFSLVDRSEYRVEKRLWRMHKRFAAVQRDPKAVPDAQFDILVKDYLTIIRRFPDSKYVPQIYSEIGSLYLLNTRYDDARKAYGEVVAKFAGHAEVVSKALVDIGNVYRIEGKVDQAVEIFQEVWDQYPKTEVGFMMPIYIAGVYRDANRLVEMKQCLAKAVTFYKGLAENTAEPDMMRIHSRHLLATTYLAQEQWEKALATWRTLLYEFADSGIITPTRLRVITRMINVTAVVRLKDYDQGITIYQDFIKDHPGHVLNPFFEKIIESLNHLRSNQGQAVFSDQ